MKIQTVGRAVDRSIKGPGKRGQLENMILSTQADKVLGTESWLDQ